jgi:hypothetical protein
MPHALQKQKSHKIINKMQNRTIVSRPEFHVFPKGALVLAINLILCTGE